MGDLGTGGLGDLGTERLGARLVLKVLDRIATANAVMTGGLIKLMSTKI